jgi:hypothetical protein
MNAQTEAEEIIRRQFALKVPLEQAFSRLCSEMGPRIMSKKKVTNSYRKFEMCAIWLNMQRNMICDISDRIDVAYSNSTNGRYQFLQVDTETFVLDTFNEHSRFVDLFQMSFVFSCLTLDR